MTVSLVQSRGSRHAAGRVRHATSEGTSEAGSRAGLFQAADCGVDPHAKDDGERLPGACRGRRVRYADVAGMSEEAVEALLFQRVELPEQRPLPDWEWVSAELGKRGVMLVWEEYRQQHRNGYSYSQFRRYFLDHTSASAEPRMRREHAPGAAGGGDYAGMNPTLNTAGGPGRIFLALL